MKKEKRTHEEFMQLLREKKAKDGRLSKVGEWFLLTEGRTGIYVKPENMRYVMK